MKTVFEHTQSNVLIIPQSLYAMKDVKLLCKNRNSAIFLKSLEQDLRDIEFYTNIPCFVYIESGSEVITNSKHETVTLKTGSSVFLPQGLNLHSDFVKATSSLKAYLVFFGDELITEYLNRLQRPFSHEKTVTGYCVSHDGQAFQKYFDSINYQIDEESYLTAKFKELMHLIAYADTQNIFHSLLTPNRRLPPAKNLRRLLDTVDTIHLSVNELAQLSGRSLSSFNREFKTIYQVTAKQWLSEKRMHKARELLESECHSVTDVAMMVGYSNVSHFIKAFKDKFGNTPKTFKAALATEKR